MLKNKIHKDVIGYTSFCNSDCPILWCRKNMEEHKMDIMGSYNYVLECTSDGAYCAYLSDYPQCCAYGETEEEALENLTDATEDFWGEVNSVYCLENIA